jgi:hypothetical protein
MKKAVNSGKKRTQKRSGRKPTQLSFFKEKMTPRIFGGSLLKGNPKTGRPLSVKEPIHLVMKSLNAFGPRSMLQTYNAKKIDGIIRTQAQINKIKLYRLINVGNHLHIILQLTDIKKYAKFIRAITGLIARHVLKKERGLSMKSIKVESNTQRKKTEIKTSFWVARPFTRLVAWGRDFNSIQKYMYKNQGQAKVAFQVWGFDLVKFGENSS